MLSASLAQQKMIKNKKSQTILISGLSGAGKTEATKYILQFLFKDTIAHSVIGQCIDESNIILEAFGNAATFDNKNSSRFSKFVEVCYDGNRIVGAQNYYCLLENSKIGHFHIFNMLLSETSENCLKAIFLDKTIRYSVCIQFWSYCNHVSESTQCIDILFHGSYYYK